MRNQYYAPGEPWLLPEGQTIWFDGHIIDPLVEIRQLRAENDRLISQVDAVVDAVVDEWNEERRRYQAQLAESKRLREALDQIVSEYSEYAMYDVLRGFDRMSAIAKAALAGTDAPG